MMDCHSVQDALDDLRDGRLNARSAAQARGHLRECPACAAQAADAERLRAVLGGPVVPLRPAVLEGLRRRAGDGRRRLTAAASLVLAVAAGALWWGQQAAAPTPTDWLADGWESRTVHLALDSERALEGVQFSLELPTGVEVQGHPGRSSLHWQDDLTVGANRLSVPLVLQAGAGGEVVARVEHEGRSRELRVSLENL